MNRMFSFCLERFLYPRGFFSLFFFEPNMVIMLVQDFRSTSFCCFKKSSYIEKDVYAFFTSSKQSPEIKVKKGQTLYKSTTRLLKVKINEICKNIISFLSRFFLMLIFIWGH